MTYNNLFHSGQIKHFAKSEGSQLKYSMVDQEFFNQVLEQLISILDKLVPDIEVTKKN
jgi:hypothetical protein